MTSTSTTQNIHIRSSYDKVFDYLQQPVNQREWAIHFVKDVKEGPDGYIAVLPFGELPLKMHSDKTTGILDMELGQSRIPTRLISKGPNECLYIFTLFRPEGISDMEWLQVAIPNLREELFSLKQILER
ncbi:MAG: hypothetical protein AAF587_17175 [Bacteroidota bacterium]